MALEPIAIVGRACTLPEAPTPEALWANVLAGRSCLSAAPADRWGLSRALALGAVDARGVLPDRTWSDVGGYVRGFDEAFDPRGFALPAEQIVLLDPLFRWVLHGVRESLRAVGHEGPSERAGLVLGNLSFPSAGMSRFAESVWLERQARGALPAGARGARPHPLNRFSSAMPAHLAAKAMGLGAGAVAIDAACASSLYAIKLACDRLHDRSADLMVAGAVNGADDLFLHVGFSALSALSRTGQSRPFHRDADGLVPAEGAGFVVLKRLADAVASGDRILGVIRGVGLSNDGRGRGLLAPSHEGQERAMRQAYAAAGISPSDVSLLECHATGTVVGDATEIQSAAAIFAGVNGLPIGSLKSNLGHLITAAGVAALLKVLGAMEAGVRPASLHADAPLDALAGTPLRLLREAEPWDGPRRAAISAFGFGGNNAHLIVEAWEGRPPQAPAAAPKARVERVAIVGIGARVAQGDGARDLARDLFDGEAHRQPRSEVAVALEGLRFPPKDLQQVLAQQLLVLEAAREAASGLALPRDRTSVLVGMGCDPEVARYGARWRIAGWAEQWAADAGASVDAGWLAEARAAFRPVLESAGVVGTMPNIVANRINGQLDLAGPSFSVSAEEASGTAALELSARALAAGEIDAAIVGAVDLSHEPVHQAALEALGHARPAGDAAVVLVLKRLADARADGNEVLAILGSDGDPGLSLGAAGVDLSSVFGSAHAASGLLHVAAAALALRHGALPHEGAPATPWLGERVAEITTSPLEAPRTTLRLRGGDLAPWLAEPAPSLHVYSGQDQEAALAALAAGRESEGGPARLVLVAADAAELAARADQARRWLAGGGPTPEGVAFRAAPIGGETAFVFTGAAAAYTGMGRELVLAMPELAESLATRCDVMPSLTTWMYGPPGAAPGHPLEQLWATSFVCQLHAELSAKVLRLTPQATIGYSSGESNALFAMGAWSDLDAMIRETRAAAIFRSELTGELEAPRRAWAKAGTPGSRWATYSVSAPLDEVRAALAHEPLAHLTIVNAPGDCVIAGESDACARAIERLGKSRAIPLGYDLAAHCPELLEIRDAWWALHRRPTVDVPGVRFYAAATGRAYRPTPEAAADAITGQAVDTLDFVRVVEQAYADGVRVFVEHGPRGLCTGWIRRILGARDHVAVPLDVQGRSGVRQVMNAAAWLVAAGVAVDAAALTARLAAAAPAARPPGAMLRLPAHPPTPQVPPFQTAMQTMQPAPPLPPVMDEPTAPPPARELVRPEAAPEAAQPAPPRELVRPAAARPTPPARELARPAPPAAPRSPMASVIASVSAHQAQLAGIHAEYVASQAAIHSRFLEMRQAMEASLLGGYRAALEGAPVALPAGAPQLRREPAPVALAPAPPPVVAAPVLISARAVVAPVPVAAPVVAAAAPAPAARALPGPKLSRRDLEIMASGRISSVLGPQFEPQDGYARQVRMPEPPLLLADRVTGIDGAPCKMGTGTIWTETDVLADSWYLDDQGRMPAGVMIEAGQADLLLIGWLGADMLNRGERVYRLLGCELTYHGGLCKPGDTLAYDIHVDGHATQGDVRLFFFHYDCRVRGEPRLSVRHGQAGFFTDRELEDSGGILWDARTEKPGDGPLDAPALVCEKPSLSRGELRAFAEGRAFDCFGPGWERTRTHVRTARIASGRMLFLDEVAELDPRGGPWGRGYLRAETTLSPDDWFFAGHFKNDPCMPGTLMFEGCLQAMAVYLAALGFTVDRDGWRFEPVPEEKYLMRCRGQATPKSRRLTYEVFVSEVSAGPIPTLFADLLCTVDGRKAFHAKRVGLRLVPDWPLSHWRELGPHVEQQTGAPLALRTLGGLRGHVDPKPVAVVDGFAFGYDSLLACAWGPPSEAFGPFYARFDGTRRVARLPGPPYHFMSRVVAVDEPIGGMQRGTKTEIEYDVPGSTWYFEQNGHETMPFAVLLEAALQPCGWLASYIGSALTTDVDLLFRNLDGTGTQRAELLPTSGTLRTKVELTSVSQSAGMIIESFKVQCLVGDVVVYDMTTVFGFFPKEAFDNQVGLPVTDAERARIDAPGEVHIDLESQPAKYCSGTLRLPRPMLLMLDRVTAFAPDGGRAGLGYLRAEKDVDVDEWFFKAHFFQDPVQPGSLGIEALIQLLQFFMLERSMGEGIAHPRFEPLMIGRPLTWKYRGQVVPKNRRITSEIEVTEIGEDAQGRYAICDGWLWVDGKRIYLAKNLGMRIVAGEPAPERPEREDAPVEERLDPAVDRWLSDHRPTWTVPALPMMSMVDRLVAAAERRGRRPVTALRDVRVARWLPFPDGEVRLRTEVTGEGDDLEVTLSAWREAADKALSRFEPVATARARFDEQPKAPALAPLDDAQPSADPYAAGTLFHGPAFQYMTSLATGRTGATAVLQAERGSVPRGALHQGLLDAATHAIPHDSLSRWSDEVSGDEVAYPYRIPEIVFHGPLPDSGEVRVEARFAGFDGSARFPAVHLQMIVDGRARVSLRLVEILLPKGPLGRASPGERAAFLRDRRHVPGLALSTFDGTTTRLSDAEVRESDWLPGTVAGLYGLPHGRRGEATVEIAVREHVARRAFVHPSALTVDADRSGATASIRPLRHHAVRVAREGDAVLVRDAAPPAQSLARVHDYWDERFGIGPWPVEDLYYGLIERFVGDVVVVDPAAYAGVHGRTCLYLGNHQVGIESLLFSIIASALSGAPTVTLAKAEHRKSWLGELIAHSFAYPGVTDPKLITFFDREDPESLMRILGDMAADMKTAQKSVMVHVEGTRSRACRQPVTTMSSTFVDMALSVGAPIVPVRFVGGLPVAELPSRIDFPVGYGRQDYWIGKPILPEELAALPYKDRKATVLAALNGLGPVDEVPSPPDPGFAARVDDWQSRTGAALPYAVLYETLAGLASPGEQVRALLEGARRGELVVTGEPRSQWLARLARWLFGTSGPRVVG